MTGQAVADRLRRSNRRWRLVAAGEVTVATVVIVLDVAIPSLVVLLLAGVSLLVRRQRPRSLGFTRLAAPLRTSGMVLLLTAGWSLLELGLVTPILERLTGQHQDLGVFADLEGDVPLLLALLAASWTLAALGEETVFRGYLPTRMQELAGRRAEAAWGPATVLVPAVLFALIHLEQGAVGVALTFLDALFLTWLRQRYGSLWAPVLGHGFSNTLGLCTFFLVGPVHALW